jgi:hypothetical protein
MSGDGWASAPPLPDLGRRQIVEAEGLKQTLRRINRLVLHLDEGGVRLGPDLIDGLADAFIKARRNGVGRMIIHGVNTVQPEPSGQNGGDQFVLVLTVCQSPELFDQDVIQSVCGDLVFRCQLEPVHKGGRPLASGKEQCGKLATVVRAWLVWPVLEPDVNPGGRLGNVQTRRFQRSRR